MNKKALLRVRIGTKQMHDLANALAFVGGMAAGGAAALAYLEKSYAAKMDAEIEATRDFYDRKYKVGPYSGPGEAVEALLSDEEREEIRDAISRLGYTPDPPKTVHTRSEAAERFGVEEIVLKDEEESVVLERVEYSKVTSDPVHSMIAPDDATDEQEAPVVEEKSIFEGTPAQGEWDFETEVANRSDDEPYIITRAEFDHDERGYERETLTYFEGDDVLVDSADDPIPDSDGVVGDKNLLRFGHGSNDNNVVLVRNEEIETEFEILRSTSSYEEKILGIRHSAVSRKNRKFGSFDE